MGEFKQITGWEEYLISKDGRVFSSKVNRELTPQKNTSGYLFITLSNRDKVKHFLIHRLLAFVYLDLPSLDSELEVDHKDTNIENNIVSNLQVLTKTEHRIKTISDNNQVNRFTIKDILVCPSCGGSKTIKATLCHKCCKVKIYDLPDNILDFETLIISSGSWSAASRLLGISDNGLRKRYKLLGGIPNELTKKIKNN